MAPDFHMLIVLLIASEEPKARAHRFPDQLELLMLRVI